MTTAALFAVAPKRVRPSLVGELQRVQDRLSILPGDQALARSTAQARMPGVRDCSCQQGAAVQNGLAMCLCSPLQDHSGAAPAAIVPAW